MLYSILFLADYLLLSEKSVPLQCVFHSIRFKVNKGWSKALLLFLFYTPTYSFLFPVFDTQNNGGILPKQRRGL